jgi:hypothetical protein
MDMRQARAATGPPPKIDTTVPHSARRYDYWLGGNDNFAADRESGDAIAAAFPAIRTAVIENRAFLRRAVTFLAAEAKIRQFLDIGTGIPTSPNVHEIAQGITSSARVIYVDNDPIVLSHARALMTSSPDGETAYIDADLLDLDKILNDADLRRVLDMSEPVALMLVAVLHFIPNDADPYGIVARLVDALPPGSYLVMSHATYDFMPPQTVAKFDAPGPANRAEFHARTREEFARFFNGLELLPPGIASIAEWRADNEPAPRPEAADVAAYGAVARKP